MITTKNLAKIYNTKEYKIRKILRREGIKKTVNNYYWWIEDQRKDEILRVLDKEFKGGK